MLRLRAEPTDAELADLNERFASMLASDRIERATPRSVEIADGDAVDLPRLALRLDQRRVGDLFRLIGAINALPSADALPERSPSA